MARPEDGEAIFALLKIMHPESGLAPMSEPKVRAVVARCAERRQGSLAGVIEGPNGLEASIGLTLSQWWYSDDWHMEEGWNFVHPAHRRKTLKHNGGTTPPSSHSRRLIEFAKWAADEVGVPLLTGVLTTKRLEPKLRLFQRQLPQVGALFLHASPMPQGDFAPQRKFARVLTDSDVMREAAE